MALAPCPQGQKRNAFGWCVPENTPTPFANALATAKAKCQPGEKLNAFGKCVPETQKTPVADIFKTGQQQVANIQTGLQRQAQKPGLQTNCVSDCLATNPTLGLAQCQTKCKEEIATGNLGKDPLAPRTPFQECQEIISMGYPYRWVQGATPGSGECQKMPYSPLDETGGTIQGNLTPEGGKPLQYMDTNSLNVPQDMTPPPYMQLGAYGDYLKNMLAGPTFGNQTLEELENARIQAMKAGSAESFNTAADELTRRINQEAEARGMFTGGGRVGAIGQGLGDLATRRMTEEAAQEAAIRGERPELLLAEKKQRAEIANIWGQMDLTAQQQNLDAFLKGRLMEYDRQFKNGELNLSAFQNNINLFGVFADYMINSARTNSDRDLVTARINEIYNNMSQTDQNNFMDMVLNWATKGLSGSFGA